MSARVVGIDLGTTNTLLAWADAEKPDRAPRIFAIPQLVTRTEIEPRDLLPSCLFAPSPGEVEGDPFHDAPYVTGEFARQRGAQVPGRLIASAKSWLCHAGVDRTAAILPWGSDDESVPKVSPLEASTRYLAHLKTTYDAAHPETPLAASEVVLTVPASFDEGARELTLEAATRAGLNVRLLEEPQAAFYDCMQRIGAAGLEALIAETPAAHVLVCDIGGGTTDLSLIRVERGDSGPVVSRIATGHHLLLGGDNMDLTLAHLCEERLETKFDPGRFAQLTAACRAAKERLLGGHGEGAPEDAAVTVLGHGAKLVGGSLTTRLTRDEVERIVLEGFFPRVERDARPQRTRGALVAFGLPYERDVAITRHIAWFVARHVSSDEGSTRIDAILLNGGVFRAARIAERVAEVVSSWHPHPLRSPPQVLPHPDPDFGVARGAVAYGLALRGHGVRIQGGAAHGYYVALGDGTKAVSVVPRGTKEDVTTVAQGVPLALTVGRPVRFDLFAADDARIDPAGTVVALDEEHFRPLPPAAVTFRSDERKDEKREIAVVLEGKLSAIGTLDLACVESDPPEGKAARRFRLAFQLRAPAVERERTTSIPPATSLRGKKFDAAHDLIDRAFGKPRPDASPRDVKDLVRELERLLGERSSWTMLDARTLYDALIPLARNRRRTADHERVFWLLAGYCLRPGFGDPNDAARVARLAALFPEKLAFVEGPRGWQQFFIAWRRVAAGMDEAAQTQIVDTFEAFVAPADRGIKKPKKLKPEALDDLLEMLSTLERLPPQRRSELGSYILERTWTDRDPRLWAALGRLGARVPAYASVHHVVTAITAERWLDHLLREKWDQVPTATRAAVELARMTGDRARDVGERVRREVEKRLVKLAAKPEWIRAVREHVPVEESDRAAFYGEGLPLGLRLIDE